MIDLLFWFLVSQSLPGLPAMAPGTEIRLVSRDLLTVYASGRVEDDRLVFGSAVTPGQEVRLLIFPPDATEQERAAALAGTQAVTGRVDEDGDDILLQFPQMDGPLSFRKWLQEERGLLLELPRPEGYR